jgi:hypothetical protein
MSILLIAVFGLLVGSFLNVCIVRLPRGRSIVTPPSHCPRCRAGISFYDNIPVISFLLLRGKCRKCGEPISWRYPIVELMNCLLYVWIVREFWITGEAFLLMALCSSLIVITFIDYDHYPGCDYPARDARGPLARAVIHVRARRSSAVPPRPASSERGAVSHGVSEFVHRACPRRGTAPCHRVGLGKTPACRGHGRRGRETHGHGRELSWMEKRAPHDHARRPCRIGRGCSLIAQLHKMKRSFPLDRSLPRGRSHPHSTAPTSFHGISA